MVLILFPALTAVAAEQQLGHHALNQLAPSVCFLQFLETTCVLSRPRHLWRCSQGLGARHSTHVQQKICWLKRLDTWQQQAGQRNQSCLVPGIVCFAFSLCNNNNKKIKIPHLTQSKVLRRFLKYHWYNRGLSNSRNRRLVQDCAMPGLQVKPHPSVDTESDHLFHLQ